MTTALQLLHPEEESNPQSLLIETLKSYPEKTVHPDGTVTTEYIETTYFLENDIWNIDFFFRIKQFQSQRAKYKGRGKETFFSRLNNFSYSKIIILKKALKILIFILKTKI